MDNLTVLLYAPTPVTFTVPSINSVKQVDWTVFWDSTFGAGGSVNFAPVGGWFAIDAPVPLSINGVATTVVPGHHYPVPAAPQAVPEGGSGLAILAFGFVAALAASRKRNNAAA
jgi:hypothetical protein